MHDAPDTGLAMEVFAENNASLYLVLFMTSRISGQSSTNWFDHRHILPTKEIKLT